MKAIVQRVSAASVRIEGAIAGQIGRGLLVYVGVGVGDGPPDVEYLANKVRYLRIFPDEAGKMNLDVQQAGGSILAISNFTLHADTRQGRRPAFTAAAPPEAAEPLFDAFRRRLAELGVAVETGCFGAMMHIESVNDGPINVIVDSAQR